MSVLVVAIHAPLRQLTFKTLQNPVNISKNAEKVSGWDVVQISFIQSLKFSSISLMHCFHLVVIRS